MEKLLQLYKFVDGVNDTPFPNASQQAVLYEFRYDAKRMGAAPTISGTIMHPQCLDDLWGSDLVYVTYNNERYFLKQTPTSSYSNEDTRYKHEADFVSERIVLNDVYFYDVIQGDNNLDKPISNSSNVVFFGDIHEFAQRLNYSLRYAKVDYSVVVDEGISSASKTISFQDQFIANALQEIYNTFEIPYYFVGKVIHIGFTNNAITKTFKYGVNDALLSITKTNANYKVVNRVTGIGSSDNIPYYYPNKYESKEQVEAEGGTWIPPQPNLMPPIYRDTLGSERFYNALNQTYINPQTDDYYEFANPYQDGKPKEQIVSFTDIKPSIVGITNASGARIDMFSEFAYDRNDNDETDEEGNYLHPYFFAKLRKFDGQFGFNLFDHAIDEDEMVISMTSGNCGACNFVIGVDSETQKNTVQVDGYGNLMRDSDGNVLFGSPQDKQNDTQNNEVWIALRKDIDTFGVIMPNATNNYKPKASDTFVILHIDLPQSYISAAESRLKDEIIKYMAMNNSEKFTFSINFSRIFFAQNPDILAQLNENARLQIEYNNKTYELYVSSYSYNMTSDKALPEIRVELSDTLTVTQNALQTAISEVKTDIMNSVGSIDWLRLGLKYFLRKDTSDRSKGKVASDVGFEIGKFVSGASGAIVYVDKETKQTVGELDKLYVRMKAYFEQLEIVNVNSVGGKQIISPAGSIRCNKVEDKEYLFNEDGTPQVNEQGEQLYNEWDFYRCYFLNEQDGEKIENRFVVGDQAYCELFNAQSGVENNISNKYYWRLVVGVGENYIDLSKEDCDKDSDVPDIGDVICHKGNRNDINRQNIIEFSSVDSFSPSITLYQGIGTLDKEKELYPYSLVNKEVVSFGVDKTTNQAFMNVYGNMYVGDRSQNTYIKYTQEKGLELKGKLEVGSTISDAMTVVEDGLIQSTLLKLGYYKDDIFKIMSGTNGLYDENVLGGGIAAWYGGPMADKEADSSLIEYAQSLFRFDGSGYLAGGNISWDIDGAGRVAGGELSWDKFGNITLGKKIKISGDENETLESILNFINEYKQLIYWDSENNAVRTTHNFIVDEAISFGGVGSSSGTGEGITTFDIYIGNNGPYPLQDGRVNLPAYPVVPINCATEGWVEENFTLIGAYNTLSQRVTALENNGTGGGSGGTTSVVSYNPSVLSGKLLGTLTINGIDNKIYAPAIPTKLSAFTNDEGYATEDWVNKQGFLTAHQSLTHLLSKTEAANTYQPKGDYAVLDDLNSYLLASTAKNTYATIQALNAATLRIDTLETTLFTEQGYIDTLQGYFTSGKANKAIADGNGNNIVDTYATKVALKDVADKVASLQDMWFFDEDHADTIRTLYNVVVDKAISFGGYGESSGSGGGITTVTKQMVLDALEYTPYDAANPKGYITASALSGYAKLTDIPSLDGYAKLTDIPSVDKYLTTNTPQTIEKAGAKIFKGAYGENIYIGGTKSGISIDINAANGGFARAISFINSADSFSNYVQFGVHGNSGIGIQNAFISVGEQDYYNAILNIYTDRIDVAGTASFSGLTTHSAGLKIGTTNVTEKSQNNTKYVEIDGNLVVTGAISFGGFGEGGSTGGGITTVTKEMVISALGFTPYNSTNPNNYVSSSVLGSLAYKNSLSFSELTGKPTTLSGYGIANAYTKDEANGKFFGIDVSGDGIDAVGITSLNKGGYGYSKRGWWGSGPALAFGSTNGYTALIQQGANSRSLHVSYKSNGGDIQEWKTLAFTDSNVLSAQNLKHSNGTLGATVSSDGNVGIGTTKPSYKLDVRGIIHTSERLNVYKWSDTTLQGGLYALIDSSNVCQLNLVSASQTTSLRNKDFNISNYTGGNITLTRVDQWDTPLAAIRIMKDSAVVVSSSDKIIRHLVAGVEEYFEKGYLEVAGMNFAITSKETNIADITGVAFDWKKDANNLELSRVYYDATTGSVLRNDFNFKVNGNIVITGAITFGSASDRRLKDNIKSMTDEQALAVLSALNPVTFNWNSTAYELGKLSGISDGFIAEEYEKLIPNSGRDIWANYRAINYERATGYLVKGWQNHETRLEKAERRIKELENELKQYRRN